MKLQTEKIRIPRWLDSNPLLKSLLFKMHNLSVRYNLDFAKYWPEHFEDRRMIWHRRAMATTYKQADEHDRESVAKEYELFKALDGFVNWYYLPERTHSALVYILDRQGRRVSSDGTEMTICLDLAGSSKQESLQNIDRKCYEFKEWFY